MAVKFFLSLSVLVILSSGLIEASKPVPRCRLKPNPGRCKMLMYRYYYNYKSQRCEVFTYGGCGGNKNSFSKLEDCQAACAKYITPTCDLPKDKGPCKFRQSKRYFYNKETGQCQTFVFGGCLGNSNNFKTKEECKKTCGNAGVDICLLPKKTGPCRARAIRYFHNSTSGTCEQFTYGGCRGNANNFRSMEACLERCPTVSVGCVAAAPVPEAGLIPSGASVDGVPVAPMPRPRPRPPGASVDGVAIAPMPRPRPRPSGASVDGVPVAPMPRPRPRPPVSVDGVAVAPMPRPRPRPSGASVDGVPVAPMPRPRLIPPVARSAKLQRLPRAANPPQLVVLNGPAQPNHPQIPVVNPPKLMVCGGAKVIPETPVCNGPAQPNPPQIPVVNPPKLMVCGGSKVIPESKPKIPVVNPPKLMVCGGARIVPPETPVCKGPAQPNPPQIPVVNPPETPVCKGPAPPKPLRIVAVCTGAKRIDSGPIAPPNVVKCNGPKRVDSGPIPPPTVVKCGGAKHVDSGPTMILPAP